MWLSSNASGWSATSSILNRSKWTVAILSRCSCRCVTGPHLRGYSELVRPVWPLAAAIPAVGVESYIVTETVMGLWRCHLVIRVGRIVGIAVHGCRNPDSACTCQIGLDNCYCCFLCRGDNCHSMYCKPCFRWITVKFVVSIFVRFHS